MANAKLSTEVRKNPLFLRNEFKGEGKYEIPLVKKQTLQ